MSHQNGKTDQAIPGWTEVKCLGNVEVGRIELVPLIRQAHETDNQQTRKNNELFMCISISISLGSWSCGMSILFYRYFSNTSMWNYVNVLQLNK